MLSDSTSSVAEAITPFLAEAGAASANDFERVPGVEPSLVLQEIEKGIAVLGWDRRGVELGGLNAQPGACKSRLLAELQPAADLVNDAARRIVQPPSLG